MTKDKTNDESSTKVKALLASDYQKINRLSSRKRDTPFAPKESKQVCVSDSLTEVVIRNIYSYNIITIKRT